MEANRQEPGSGRHPDGLRARPPATQVYAALVRAVHDIAQAGARELRRHGVSPAQYQVLVAAAEHPGCTQHDLTARLGVTKGNVSQLVTRLEAADLLTRTPAGPRNELTLTTQGRVLLRQLRPEHDAFLQQRFAVLTDDELATLHALVATLADAQ